jgi:hypothetical protein
MGIVFSSVIIVLLLVVFAAVTQAAVEYLVDCDDNNTKRRCSSWVEQKDVTTACGATGPRCAKTRSETRSQTIAAASGNGDTNKKHTE